jgi:16S rRNA (guanine966-N2)-methyltransferase
MTRIIAGVHGGRRLLAPAGAQTRPTSDRVREAFFSTLTTMTDVDGARFADLYAGSGAVGLEAVSRGAAFSLLVEAEPKAARTIRENVATLKLGAAARLVTGKVAQVLAAEPEGGPFDIVFADPPYALGDDELAEVQHALVGNGWLADGAVVVLERSTRTAVRGTPLSWVDGITADRSKRYGETTLWYGRRS